MYPTTPCLIMVFNRRIDDMQKVMLRGGNGSRQACAFFGEKLSQLISIMLLVPQVYPSYPPLVFGFLFSQWFLSGLVVVVTVVSVGFHFDWFSW